MFKHAIHRCLSKSILVSLSLITLSGIGLGSVNASTNTIHTHNYSTYASATRAVYRTAKRNNHHSTSRTRAVRRMTHLAKSKLGDPYVWGGNGPKSFDCSGFTKYIYQHGAHKTIPRLANQQFYSGTPESEHHAKAGDLVFFGSSKANITHVGMYLGHDKMIDSQLRGVVIEKIHEPWWHAVGFARM